MAPEELDPLRGDIRADIYSLGCTLYRFLAGLVPFPGGDALSKMRRHQRAIPAALTALRGDVPARLA
jgi:serine/threonine-protein kinase